MRRNDPYAGGYITRHYGRPREGVHALQIEIARELYMDESADRAAAGLRRSAAQDHAALIAGLARGRAACSERGADRAGNGAKKMAAPCGAAKFREETSKKADSAAKDRIAAMHKLGDRSFACKRFFAMQHHGTEIARRLATIR